MVLLASLTSVLTMAISVTLVAYTGIRCWWLFEPLSRLPPNWLFS